MGFSSLELLGMGAVALVFFIIGLIMFADATVSMDTRDTRHAARILLMLRDEGEKVPEILICPTMKLWLRHSVLMHLSQHGYVASEYENVLPNVDGTPRRRVYWITDKGRDYLKRAYDPATGGMKDEGLTA